MLIKCYVDAITCTTGFFSSKIDKNLNSIDIKLNIVLIIEQNIHCKL
jgi:hypothetical protein